MLPPYIFLTALTAQFAYILVNWYFFRRKEYVYYLLYILSIVAYFLNKYFSNSDDGVVTILGINYYSGNPDRILAVLSYIFYFKFGRHFVEANNRYSSINTLMIYTERFLFVYIIIDILIIYFTLAPDADMVIFLPINILIFCILIFVFRALIKKNEALDRFILTGSAFYALSAVITLWMGFDRPQFNTEHLIVLQIGAIVEMVLLNAGLVYKSRMLQNQTIAWQKELIRKYEENQDLLLRLGSIREKFSRDLHDDVGATLSSVKAYAEILQINPHNHMVAQLIKENSTEMIEKLELIAWATNPENDKFMSLKNTMLKFSVPLCHSQQIQFNLNCEQIDDELLIPGEIRQNVFLIFKEAINNSIKYAEATENKIDFFIIENSFVIEICDNGKGWDGTVKGTGTGWQNMHKRAKLINGELQVKSKPGEGTSINLIIPYPFRT